MTCIVLMTDIMTIVERYSWEGILFFKHEQGLPSEDIAYRKIRDIMGSDVSRMWTVEICELYKEVGGFLTCETLVKKIADTFGSKLLVLCIENIDDENVEIDKVANVVIHKINSIPFQRDIYNKHIDVATAKQDVSPL